MEVTQLTEEQFDEKFTLVTNKFDDNASFNGCLHETFGAELEYVREMASLNRVITIIEGESEESDDEDGFMNLYYTSGMHHVNRLGYLITTEPIDDNFEFEVKLD